MRLKNLDQDLTDANLTKEEIGGLSTKDFLFDFVPKDDKVRCNDVRTFIERHEWLGKMPTRPTHRFITTYKGHLAGVVVMATPNSVSNLLGEGHRQHEKLISRGACISWSPKNLASSLVMFAIRWMAKNTEFRYFTAYSDIEARELGTIYQACNFIYLGQNSGARFEYFDPKNPERGYFSDRLFRRASFIKRKALEFGLPWNQGWHDGEKVLWDHIPEAHRFKIEAALKSYQDSCVKRALPFKHKYVYILGRTKTETKRLRQKFQELNHDKIALPYPKLRTPLTLVSSDTATPDTLARPCRVLDRELTKRPNPCWPLDLREPIQKKKFYSIKEVVNMYGISSWLIYHHIKTDPTFPVVNVGIKKRFLIDPARFDAWLESKTKKFQEAEHNLISAEKLLGVG